MTRKHLITGMGAAACFTALAVLYVLPPARYGFYPPCPIHAYTHVLCPGCGGTRALHELLHLHLRAALHYNALLTALAPPAFLWFACCAYRSLRRETFAEFSLPRPAIFALLVLTVVFGVARNAGIGFVM